MSAVLIFANNREITELFQYFLASFFLYRVVKRRFVILNMLLKVYHTIRKSTCKKKQFHFISTTCNRIFYGCSKLKIFYSETYLYSKTSFNSETFWYSEESLHSKTFSYLEIRDIGIFRHMFIFRVTLFHDKRSNDLRYSDARVMHKLCLSLHVMERVMRRETAYLIRNCTG